MTSKPFSPDPAAAQLYEAHRAMLAQAASLAAHLRELATLVSTLEQPGRRPPSPPGAAPRIHASRLAPYVIQPGAATHS